MLDWGIAKLVARSQVEPNAPPVVFDFPGSDESDLTIHGQTLGTPAYMAPEQAAGRVDLIDHRTDVYGLGAILYEILTGQPPFTGPDILEVLRRVKDEQPIQPVQLNPEVPPALQLVCLQALAKKPADRYATASELGQLVQQWQDVQRRQAEDALRQQTRILHSIIDSMADGVVVADSDGRFMLFNPAADRLLGIGSTDTPPDRWAERYGCYRTDGVTPYRTEDLPLVRAFRGDEADGVELFMRNENLPAGMLISVNARPLKDDNGMLQGGVVVFRDITDQKHAGEALRESEERYRSVITAMKEGIVLFAADGNILACNASAERILGLSADQVIGLSARDPRWRAIRDDGTPFPEDEFPAVVTLRTGNPCRDVFMGVYKPDDTLTWIANNSQALFSEKELSPDAVMASFTDISDRRRLEEELQHLQAELGHLRKESRNDKVA